MKSQPPPELLLVLISLQSIESRRMKGFSSFFVYSISTHKGKGKTNLSETAGFIRNVIHNRRTKSAKSGQVICFYLLSPTSMVGQTKQKVLRLSGVSQLDRAPLSLSHPSTFNHLFYLFFSPPPFMYKSVLFFPHYSLSLNPYFLSLQPSSTHTNLHTLHTFIHTQPFYPHFHTLQGSN